MRELYRAESAVLIEPHVDAPQRELGNMHGSSHGTTTDGRSGAD
jgi:hypothetical protein